MSCGSGKVAGSLVPRSHAATYSITAQHAVASAWPTPSEGAKGTQWVRDGCDALEVTTGISALRHFT
jgi:hypothetical protein